MLHRVFSHSQLSLPCPWTAGTDTGVTVYYHYGSRKRPDLTKVKRLTEYLCHCWHDGEIPQDLKDARIVHLYKGKGDKSSCDNYRGISLLAIAGKILAKITLNRLSKHLLDEIVPESQCGFRKNRGTVDIIFASRQVQEKCREQNKDLYILFVDLTKAFDTVSRPGLWNILPRLGIPPKMVKIIQSFHDGMKARLVAWGRKQRVSCDQWS